MSVPSVPTSPSAASLAAVVGVLFLTVVPVPAAAQQEAAPAASQGKPAAAKAAPSPKSLAEWRGKLIAHLNSRKRKLASADGTSMVTFSIDRSGKVISVRVLKSSGNAVLDQEAIALTKRASPLPAPPADLAGATLNLTVAIRFKS